MNKGLTGTAKVTLIFIVLATMLFLIYNSVSLASADNATLLTDNANLNINPDCGCLGCSSHLNYTSCSADFSCTWCALCQYSSQASKVNQWLQAKCVNRGTSCGWQCVLGQCGANCIQDSQCSCPTSGCVGNDWYQYPSHGTCGDCETSCSCKNGTANDQPCYPTVTRNDKRCVECNIDNDCNKLDKNYCDGTTIKHDEGKCVSHVCQSITSTVKNCNDGLFCNGQETCQNAACVSGASIDCSSLNTQCQSGKCDESLDKCLPDYSKFPYSTPCSSNDICKVNHCDGSGSCVLNYNVDCNDNNACTSDFCDSLTGCKHTPVNCDDGDACTADSCDSVNGCTHAPIQNCCKTNAECNDNNACTNDVCSSNRCQHNSITCNDNVGCTDDTCDTTKGCVYTPNDNKCPSDTTCADYYCDANLGCKANYASSSTPCEADNKFCTVDRCDGSGNCVYWKDYNCSSYNISAIATCDNTPDNYHFTWDSRNPFTSACVEDGSNQGHCTTGNNTTSHACSVSSCGAECDSTHSCDNKCIGNVTYYSGNCNLASCNCSYTTDNCTTHNGCYAYGNGCENRDYSCALGGCNYTFSSRNTDYNDSFVNYCSADTIRKNQTLHDFGCNSTCLDHTSFVNDSLVQNCNDLDGWYNTTTTQWIDIDQCNERQQLQQQYRDYTCSAANCTFNVNNTQWINTSQTRNKPNGTACNDGLFCTVNDVCTSGNCGGSSRDCSSNNLVEISNCDNNPDTNPFTFDYAPGFTSVCNETLDICTNSSYNYTHTCADANSTDSGPAIPVGNGIRTCTAECDGFGTECQNKCINNVRYFSGACNLTSCGCSYSSTDNCTSYNGCYAYGNGCEDRAYGCAPGNCTYTPSNQHNDSYDNFVNYCSADTIRTNRTFHDFGCGATCNDHTSFVNDSLVSDCSIQNGWYNTTNYQWISETQCTERQQIEQEYRKNTCDPSTVNCTYSVNDTKWINTTNTRNKVNGTSCDDGLFCTVNDVCTLGACGGSPRDCSGNNISSIATCFNIPDNYSFTWDFRNVFTSSCQENGNNTGSCTSGNGTITHTCSVDNCSADCDATHSCNDKCVGDVRYYSGNCSLTTCNCSYSTQNCNLQDGWYNTTNTQWNSTGQCTEKEQIQQEYRDYTCSAAACTYSVKDHQWVDSGNTRNKEDGTSCDDGLYCTNPDTCTVGVCGGPSRDCSINNLPGIAQCDYSPDSNPFTFDYAPGFTSVCNETLDKCTNSSYSFSHTCADSDSADSGPVIPLGNGIRTCTAECDGFGTECQNKCVGNVRYFSGSCDLSSCGCSYSSENCSSHNGCYAYGNGCEDRAYSCAPSGCTYDSSNQNTDYLDGFVNYCSGAQIRENQTLHDFGCNGKCDDHTNYVNDSLVQDCSLQSGWFNTTSTQWVNDTQCTEKEQIQQEYRDYTCSDASCSYNVTGNQWIDSGNTRSKENGTSCDDGLYCTVNDVCTAGVCGGVARNCSSLNGQCQKGACNEDLDACVPDYSDFPLSTPCQADENKCTLDHCNGSGECVFWKNASAPNAPNKTIGEPQTKCQEGEWCEYKITTLTPITLSCGNDTNVSWRYALDGEWKEWHTNESPVTIYFPEESNHTLEAYCTDACGESTHDIEKFKVEGTAFEIPLYKKWNLISVPFVLTNDSPSEVFKNVSDSIVSVWTYDNGDWYTWSPDVDGTLTSIKPGWGYWILANNDTDLLIGGELFSPITTPPSKNLQEGWNLVGYYGTEWQTYNIESDNCGYDSYKYGNYVYCSLNSLIDTQQGSPRWSSVWGFDNCGNDTTSWNTLDSCNRMFAGKGYWMEMDVPDGYAPASNCMWDKEFKCLAPTI